MAKQTTRKPARQSKRAARKPVVSKRTARKPVRQSKRAARKVDRSRQAVKERERKFNAFLVKEHKRDPKQSASRLIQKARSKGIAWGGRKKQLSRIRTIFQRSPKSEAQRIASIPNKYKEQKAVREALAKTSPQEVERLEKFTTGRKRESPPFIDAVVVTHPELGVVPVQPV